MVLLNLLGMWFATIMYVLEEGPTTNNAFPIEDDVLLAGRPNRIVKDVVLLVLVQNVPISLCSPVQSSPVQGDSLR